MEFGSDTAEELFYLAHELRMNLTELRGMADGQPYEQEVYDAWDEVRRVAGRALKAHHAAVKKTA